MRWHLLYSSHITLLSDWKIYIEQWVCSLCPAPSFHTSDNDHQLRSLSNRTGRTRSLFWSAFLDDGDDAATRLIISTPCHVYSIVSCLSSSTRQSNLGFLSIYSYICYPCWMRLRYQLVHLPGRTDYEFEFCRLPRLLLVGSTEFDRWSSPSHLDLQSGQPMDVSRSFLDQMRTSACVSDIHGMSIYDATNASVTIGIGIHDNTLECAEHHGSRPSIGAVLATRRDYSTFVQSLRLQSGAGLSDGVERNFSFSNRLWENHRHPMPARWWLSRFLHRSESSSMRSDHAYLSV